MPFPLSTPGSVPGTRSKWIAFHTSGATFSPLIAVDSGAVICWKFDDGTTSASATPTKNYGAPGAHVARLNVMPWEALQTVNVGYDQGDQGRYMPDTPQIAQQNVTAIYNLQAAHALEILTVSNNVGLTSIDASGLAHLLFLEAFAATGLASVDVTGCTSLLRACLEGCPTTAISGLADCSFLRDLRNRGGHMTTYALGANTCSHLYHFCVGDTATLTSWGLAGKTLSALEECWLWSSYSVTGSLVLNAPILTDLRSQGCALTGADLSLCTSLTNVQLSGNGFGQSAVDAVLAELAARSTTGGVVNLSGNGMAVPSSAGIASAATLTGRGWTVGINL
jgi:hypothetical protein